MGMLLRRHKIKRANAEVESNKAKVEAPSAKTVASSNVTKGRKSK